MKSYSSWERLARSKVLYTVQNRYDKHDNINYLPALILECTPNLDDALKEDTFDCTIMTCSGTIRIVKRISKFIDEDIEQLMINVMKEFE